MNNLFLENKDKIGLEVYEWLKDHYKEIMWPCSSIHVIYLCPDGKRVYRVKMIISDITGTPEQVTERVEKL